MSISTRWSDLAPRVMSALVMSIFGAVIVWFGGWLFVVSVSLICGLIAWETARMFGADNSVRAGVVIGLATLVSAVSPWFVVLPAIIAAALVCVQDVQRDRALFLTTAVWIMLACLAAIQLRIGAGMIWLLWLLLVVVVSDVAGYFAGRMIGGPKFWPSISPKKTWSGTIAGWLGAALVGYIFAGSTGAGALLILVSVAVSFSGQMGDIVESAQKRRAGVKDSSNLIPGHGGVFDRFDAFLGASVMTSLLWFLQLLPGLS